MQHSSSDSDRQFRNDFESASMSPDSFGHRAHVRVAYTYLTEFGVEDSCEKMHSALVGFLRSHGIEPTEKYHATMTRAWILAVRHFMESSPEVHSANEFIDRNPNLLDSSIMLTHYSTELLFSTEARNSFVEPDLDWIPRYE